MMLWIAVGLLSALVIGLLALPLARGGARAARAAPSSEPGLAFYRDQLAELQRERAEGLVSPEDHAAAKLEIERRLLAAASRAEVTPADSSASASADLPARARTLAIALALVVPAGALLVYLQLGRPGAPDLPLAARQIERGPDMGEALAAVERLRRQVEQAPEDLDLWIALARAERAVDNYVASAAALKRALVLSGGDAQILSALGETLTVAADGIVTPEARQMFVDALARRPGDARARFFLALAKMQAGDGRGALADWQALEHDSPADAPWRGALRQHIVETARQLGEPPPAEAAAPPRVASPGAPTGAPLGERGPSAADVRAAEDMTPEQRQAMIRSMVEGLAQRLETNPADIEGWRRLARAWGVLEETEKAREAWRRAAEVAPERVDVLLDYARALFPPGGAIERPPETFIALMRRINALDANVPEPLFWLGIDAANRGDTAEARAKWTALLARVPGDSPVAVELKRRLEALPR